MKRSAISILLLFVLFCVSILPLYAWDTVPVQEQASTGKTEVTTLSGINETTLAATENAMSGQAKGATLSETAETTPADLTDTVQITVPFTSLGDKILSWNFPYSDALFRKPSTSFSEDLAKASLGLMVSAFYCKDEGLEPQFETFLSGAGFQDIYTFGYDQETSKDTLAGIIGWKQVDDFILIAAAPRGSGYEKEWAGNLEVGSEERHVGFNRGAQIMERELLSYIENHNLSGKKKLWLSGFSRAAAVSNLTAADMINSGSFDDIYAYLFGVPRTTKAPDHADYKGIYNICGKNDPVPQVPTEHWGYYRYGQDLFTPSCETDSRYFNMAILAEYVSSDLTGDQFLYSPEISYSIHVILEFLNEMFPTSADYEEKFQDTLMSIWTEADPDNILDKLLEASATVEFLDQREKSSAHIFSNYISMLISQLTSENPDMISSGHWNPRQGLGENILREHMPYTYISWVFSGVPEEDLYHGANLTRRLSLFGDIDVEVWKDDVFITGRTADDTEIYLDDGINYFDILDNPDNYDYYIQRIVFLRRGNETILNLPADNCYDILIRSNGPNNLVYYDIFSSAEKTFSSSGRMYTQNVSGGEYHLTVDHDNELPRLTTKDGRITAAAEMTMKYSPTFVMANECESRNYASMDDIFRFLIIALIVIAVTLLASLIIYIIHTVQAKRGKGPFSHWYVIIPHLVLIALFIMLNMYVTYYLFSIGIARKVLSILTFLCIFLLALRGLIRRRVSWNVIITVFVLCAALIDFFIYQPSHLVTSSVWSLIIYAVIMAIFAGLAATTFFIAKKKASQI